MQNDMPPPSSISTTFLQTRNSWLDYIKTTGLTYGGIEKCVFVSPGTRKHKGSGYKCPSVDIFWKAFDNPPIIEFDNKLFFEKSVKACPLTLNRETYMDNAIAILTGFVSAMPGDNEIKQLTDEKCFYFMSSASVNNCSMGLYLNVENTIFHKLHQSVSEDECAANCEVVSCIDDMYQCEVLVLRILRNVRIGEQLILSARHRHGFQLNNRGHGRKLTWFKDVTFLA